MNLLTCLYRLKSPFAAGVALAAQLGPAADDSSVATEAESSAATVHGCGWFDSSHELQQGLLVREHLDPTTLATEMPLGPWLELHLSSWRPALVS